ncbi:F-box protein At5g50450-like [Phragmites australis]|uniref:F-box protein At5g50450-like n=1 Tax=Phragmites australis TaxID=29695 RepID=UPI002D78EBCB|nr:F-box protein At5g50450-like [Phragmites australis]
MKTTRGAESEAKAEGSNGKRLKVEEAPVGYGYLGAFEFLPQELIVSVLAAVSSSADKPADLFSAMLTYVYRFGLVCVVIFGGDARVLDGIDRRCKKFSKLGKNPLVRKVASAQCVAVRAASWCRDAYHFLCRCGNDGNADANYLLGMIQFYCLGKRPQGWSRMVKAASARHTEALYALAIIRLNDSGVPKEKSDYASGARLCAAAATLGHTGALRELGNCIVHGLGVPQDIVYGCHLTVWANVQELHAKYPAGPELDAALAHVRSGNGPTCLTSNFGCFAAVPSGRYLWSHPANKFLAEWFAAHPLPPPRVQRLLMCSVPTCGRPETRPLEFRRCTVCTIARYCSHTCQALHWRTGHSSECIPMH